MQFTAAATLSALALAGSSLAQTVQSAPFNLIITSDNEKYNQTALGSCHSGAGIESLCVFGGASGSADAAVYNLNTTNGEQTGVPSDGLPGTLTWFLPAEPTGESQAANFFIQPSTNVVQYLFGLGEPVSVSFDKDNEMNIQSIYDDTVTPPTDDTYVALYRWHLCETNFEAYDYITLNWVLGSGAPTNPSCEPVTVTRVFTSS